MGYAWSGISLEETKAGRQSYLIFGLALLLVYLTLAAQYESLVLPFIVLLGVPVAVLGALAAQWSRGFANDVYCQVGLVMLVGLAAKNAILIVEFAEQLRDRGMTVVDAAIESARIRLRPILMTSLAFILGVLPSRRRDRCRTGSSAVGWNDSGGRHVRVNVPQPAIHPGALCRGPVHPRSGLAEADGEMPKTPRTRPDGGPQPGGTSDRRLVSKLLDSLTFWRIVRKRLNFLTVFESA